MATVVMIHGAWHGGWCWAPVAAHLTEKGHTVFAPTMPGHGVTARREGVTNEHCVEALVDYVADRELEDVILVGHSWAGTVMPTVAAQLGDRARALVFVNAFVLERGECQLDVLPTHYVEPFEALAGSRPDRTLPPPPFELWQQSFMQDAEEGAQRLAHSLLSPTPFGCMESRSAVAARDLDIPSSYVFCREDITLTEEFAFTPRFADRLGQHRLVETAGSHEACLSQPIELAEAIHESIVL